MTRLQRVFIDTSELFPFTIMDVLLTMSEYFLFTWVWTDESGKEGSGRKSSSANVSALRSPRAR